jgi:hypothetical protein
LFFLKFLLFYFPVGMQLVVSTMMIKYWLLILFVNRIIMASFSKATLRRINASRSILLICDIQERFRSLIHEFPTVIHNTVYIKKVTSIMQIPCVITEQYPKAFGRTVSELLQNDNEVNNSTHHHQNVFEKRQFSMITDDVASVLEQSGKTLSS